LNASGRTPPTASLMASLIVSLIRCISSCSDDL
jgi:hypothetical protein